MIILGLGSNLHSSFGDRFKNIDLAISYLKFYKIKVLNISSFYETPSYPDNKNPKFINVVIEISTNLALSYIQAGKKVIYVDADLRKPVVHKIFNAKKKTELVCFQKNTDIILILVFHSNLLIFLEKKLL